MFESLLQKISEHPTYAKAMDAAVAEGVPLVLNYHTHGPDTGYCISICAWREPVIKLLGEGELEELVHIRGFAKEEADCVPLSTAFGQALSHRYSLKQEPGIYLNGKPVEDVPPGMPPTTHG